MTNLAIHIEIADGDLEKAKGIARKLGTDLKARSAMVSSPDGTWDVLKPAAIEAETEDGKKVKVKNPEAYIPVPKKFERVADDPTPEQIRESRGETKKAKGA
jgi:hypothetical protein